MLLFTRLEWRILKNRFFVVLSWLLMLGCYFYLLCYDIALFVVGFSWQIPIFIIVFKKEQVFFPKEDYFRKIFICSKKEERIIINHQTKLDITKKLRLGEAVFLDDYVIFTQFGVVLKYKEIKKITHKKYVAGWNRKEVYQKVLFETNCAKSYFLKIWNNDDPFIGESCIFKQAQAWIEKHKV